MLKRSLVTFAILVGCSVPFVAAQPANAAIVLRCGELQGPCPYSTAFVNNKNSGSCRFKTRLVSRKTLEVEVVSSSCRTIRMTAYPYNSDSTKTASWTPVGGSLVTWRIGDRLRVTGNGVDTCYGYIAGLSLTGAINDDMYVRNPSTDGHAYPYVF